MLLNKHINMKDYPIKMHLSYYDFLATVKEIDTCSVFIDREYKPFTPAILDKLKSGELKIIEYHDTPLGEVIYLEAASVLQ